VVEGADETVLAGGDVNVVVKVGDTVRRPTGFWSPAVHALLRHFEHAGFDGAPRFLGIDEQGREILSYVEGDAVRAPVPPDDELVAEIGALLRRMHDAQAGFAPPPEARWQRLVGADFDSDDVVAHNDLFWTNLILRDGRPAALIDWDLAAPAPREVDLASAANYWVPLRPDEQAAVWGVPTDRRGERLRLLCDAYGLDRDGRLRLLDVAKRKNQIAYDTQRTWGGEEKRPGWKEMWESGVGNLALARRRWLAENRAALERYL
jgi:Phosphotransferase enzyme family